MLYTNRKLLLRNGRAAVLRSPHPTMEDAAELCAYLQRCSAETPYMLRNVEECAAIFPERELAYLQTVADSPNACMIACEIDGHIIGNCGVNQMEHRKTQHRATIGIAIFRAYWGLGIGSALMQAAIDTARGMGVEQLELDYMEDNTRGRRLYEKFGFQETGRHPNAIHREDGSRHALVDMILSL